MIGYGAQGRAEALNLRKSEIPFLLGLRPDGDSIKKAEADGFEVASIKEVAASSELILINIPDQVQAELYQTYLKSQKGKTLVFAHGFNTHFGLIPIENDMKHVLIAPKGAAAGLESLYKTDDALPAVLAYRDQHSDQAPDEAKQWMQELALALGCHPKSLSWARFADETICDLFSEQALLCGGVSSLLRKTYEVLVEAGYNKETAYFETLFELKLIVDMIWKNGITGMRSKISPTARYGDVTRGDKIIDDHVKQKMKKVLKQVEDGSFAKEFLENAESKDYQLLQSEQAAHAIEKIGKELRAQRAD